LLILKQLKLKEIYPDFQGNPNLEIKPLQAKDPGDSKGFTNDDSETKET
jgi:hypothetical protein